MKSTQASLLQGLAWLLFAIAGLAFWIGGRALHDFAKTDRMLAEMEGIGIAVVCGVLGSLTKAAGDRLAEAQKLETSMFNDASNDGS
jgi:hypothetical protein